MVVDAAVSQTNKTTLRSERSGALKKRKRVTEKSKSSGPKSKTEKIVGRQSGHVFQMQKSSPSKTPPPPDPKYTQAVQNYESGLKAMQERKFDKAKGSAHKVAGDIKDAVKQSRE